MLSVLLSNILHLGMIGMSCPSEMGLWRGDGRAGWTAFASERGNCVVELGAKEVSRRTLLAKVSMSSFTYVASRVRHLFPVYE